jgi:hypothetical protein
VGGGIGYELVISEEGFGEERLEVRDGRYWVVSQV